MIQPERVVLYNKPTSSGSYVVYWMQSAVRTRYNHALEYAIEQSNELKKPLYVVFALHPEYKEFNPRIEQFFKEGISDVYQALKERGISFTLFSEEPVNSIVKAADDAILLVMDQGWTRLQRIWRSQIISSVSCHVAVIETNLIVPVNVASQKEEWSAGTFRPKLSRIIKRFLVPVSGRRINTLSPPPEIFSGKDIIKNYSETSDSDSQSGISIIKGGQNAAVSHLGSFLSDNIDRYELMRNDPSALGTSRLSAYLHFGQISPLEVTLQVLDKKSPGGSAFLEQLIVRRELSHNFVGYNNRYDSFEGLPDWAKNTLGKHSKDNREYIYDIGQFERAETHNRIWNAIQTELVRTGYIHGYLRMYWGKKILEWSRSPEEGYNIALTLNDRYQLDGRDPNGYAGIAWCFGKHDRPWKEREIFGTIRYMNESGLRRKFKVDGWCERVEREAAKIRF